MLRCAKISLFKLLLRNDFKWLVSVQNFLLLHLYPAKLLLPVTCPFVLHKTHCHWNIFGIYRADVVDNMLMPLLVRHNFDLSKCWCFMFLLWSIKLLWSIVFICTHLLQMVIHYLSFMLMFILCGNDVGNRGITCWRFCGHGQVNNWLYNMSCIFIGWDVISPNMEDNVIWFISYYRLVYDTSYLFTVKWV